MNTSKLADEQASPRLTATTTTTTTTTTTSTTTTPSSAQQRDASSTWRPYSGVDKLIFAAMMEESAAVAALTRNCQAPRQLIDHNHHHHHHHNNNNHHQQQAASGGGGVNVYMPSGRGIGGYLTMRDAAMEVPTPSNKSELELYRLLERANLLSYFGVFLNFGGDDVQQLSDADEEEFLEIMSLVGMTQKPLHVRRLQKALIEWRESKETDSKCHVTGESDVESSQEIQSI